MFAFVTNIPKLRKKIDEEIKLLQGGFVDGVRNMIGDGRNLVERLTPRSSATAAKFKKTRGSRGQVRYEEVHIADGWTTHSIGGGGKGRVPILFTIYNEMTHDRAGRIKKRAFLRSAAGQTKPYTLLHILEYGSRPHKIVPSPRFRKTRSSRGQARYTEVKGRQVLRFEIGGQVVYTKSVDHPGTKAHAMVRLTKVQMENWFSAYGRKWAERLAQEWRR